MEYLRQNWKYFVGEGVVYSLIGIAALLFPWLFSISFDIYLGALFLVVGFWIAIRLIFSRGLPGNFFAFLGSVLLIVAGLLLLFFPKGGLMTITFILSILFFADGCFRMMQAFQLRLFKRWTFLFFNGMFEVLIALLIWLGWPTSAFWFVGILIGVNFLLTGLFFLMIGFEAKKKGI